VYTPLFSGGFRDAQDVMLEDVERIEVISCPGATLWGANAANAVSSAITRRASDTEGACACGRAGHRERGGGARHGGAMGSAGWGQLQVQSYFEHTERDIPGTFAERLNIFDVEFQHGLRAIGAHRLTWGGGYRYGDDRVSNSAVVAFLPAHRGLRWANVFAQD